MDIAGVDIDLARISESQQVVLVEGRSDKAALEVLAQRRGRVLGPGGICVVASGRCASSSGSRPSSGAAPPRSCTGSWEPDQAGRASTRAC